MSNAILNVKEVPNLLFSKFHSNTISWREENGALVFQPIDNEKLLERRRAAFERLKSYSGVLRENIDYEKEKMEWLDEKYACVD